MPTHVSAPAGRGRVPANRARRVYWAMPGRAAPYAMVSKPDLRRGSACAFLSRGHDAALQAADFGRELAVRHSLDESIDAALELDRADRIGAESQPHRPDRVRQQRDRLQIGQKAPLRLDVGVAHIVADLNALAGHRTFAGHAAPRFAQTVKRTARPLQPRATGYL